MPSRPVRRSKTIESTHDAGGAVHYDEGVFLRMKYALVFKLATRETAHHYRPYLLGCFIGGPANGRTRHCRDDPRFDALEEAADAFSLIQQAAACHEAVHRSQLGICRATPRLEHGFYNVHGRGQRCRKASGHRTRRTVCEGVVVLLGVHGGGDGLVREELQRGEGHRHG